MAFDPVVRSDLTLARKRNQRLCIHAVPVMQLLLDHIVNTDSIIVRLPSIQLAADMKRQFASRAP